MKSNPMTDPCVEAVGNLLDHLRRQTTLRKTASISDKEVALLSSHFAAMHSSRPVEDDGNCILGDECGNLSELSALKREIERKDAAIRRYISVHGVLTDDDRKYLRQALSQGEKP